MSKICDQTPNVTSSIGVRGNTKDASEFPLTQSGAGKAWRLTLPLIVNGKAFKLTKADGIAYSGNLSSKKVRSSLTGLI